MRQLSKKALAGALHLAQTAHNDATEQLSQLTFLQQQTQQASWAIGPFEQSEQLTFTLDQQWPDPDGIGWASESIINPTTIEHDGQLHVFYRASPRKESLASRIGHAIYTPNTGWRDQGEPTIRPTLDNEILGVEDPKIYQHDDGFVLFYNGIFPVEDEDRRLYPSPNYPVEGVGCDINVATSHDLQTWTKHGPITDHAVTRLWAKGAVIPRDSAGRAAQIEGWYLMFLSEGCDGDLHVGRSHDLLRWHFDLDDYLDLTALDGTLHEVATAIVHDDHLVLDLFYSDAHDRWAAAQALYPLQLPLRQLDITPGGTLAWGGLAAWQNRLTFAQGWDTPLGQRQLQFYAGPTA